MRVNSSCFRHENKQPVWQSPDATTEYFIFTNKNGWVCRGVGRKCNVNVLQLTRGRFLSPSSLIFLIFILGDIFSLVFLLTACNYNFCYGFSNGYFLTLIYLYDSILFSAFALEIVLLFLFCCVQWLKVHLLLK